MQSMLEHVVQPILESILDPVLELVGRHVEVS